MHHLSECDNFYFNRLNTCDITFLIDVSHKGWNQEYPKYPPGQIKPMSNFWTLRQTKPIFTLLTFAQTKPTAYQDDRIQH